MSRTIQGSTTSSSSSASASAFAFVVIWTCLVLFHTKEGKGTVVESFSLVSTTTTTTRTATTRHNAHHFIWNKNHHLHNNGKVRGFYKQQEMTLCAISSATLEAQSTGNKRRNCHSPPKKKKKKNKCSNVPLLQQPQEQEQQQQHAEEQDDDDMFQTMGIEIPFGLRQTILKNAQEYILKRFWIVDNSGSMALWDGHQMAVTSSSQLQHDSYHHDDHSYYDSSYSSSYSSSCTRWCEVQEVVNCHAQLSSTLHAPTEFRLLNPPKKHGPFSLVRGPQRFQVGYGRHKHQQQQSTIKDCKRAQSIMLRNEPNGQTPLASAIWEVRRDIVQLLPKLEATQTKACVVICTDGSNYSPHNVDGQVVCSSAILSHETEVARQAELVQALESLHGLPVCLVLRLCTDYQPIVQFFNNLDQHLLGNGYDLDVLDDHYAEAVEVNHNNPWFNYALIVHRLREMGQVHRVLDLLDERPLTRSEICILVQLLFGESALNGIVDKDKNNDKNNDDDKEWLEFLNQVDQLQQHEEQQKQWNPMTQSRTVWIDTNLLTNYLVL